MNFETFSKFNSLEEGKEQLKKAVQLRDQMGGALYFNMMNDDCCELGNKLVEMGANKEEIGKLIGKENYN